MANQEIARRTVLSRNTIRKYLNTGTVEPKYPERYSPSKLDLFAQKLAAWLKTEAKKSRKQRRNLRHLYADLTSLGYEAAWPPFQALATSAAGDGRNDWAWHLQFKTGLDVLIQGDLSTTLRMSAKCFDGLLCVVPNCLLE